MKRHLMIAAGALTCLHLAACFCVPFAGGNDGNGRAPDAGSCEPARQQTCFDWRCATGGVISRKPRFGQTSKVGGLLEGQAFASEGIQVAFSAAPRADGSWQGRYTTELSECAPLVINFTDRTHASLVWDGVELTGRGALSEAQKAAVESLKKSPYISLLVQVPLDLGCHPDLEEGHVGALLFPLQLLLKYDSTPNTRAAWLEKLGKESHCRYFGARQDLKFSPAIDGGALLGPLQFAPSDLIPNVFGFWALDVAGATEATGLPLEGDLLGPCGARCRGACGPDCPNTCRARTTTECATDGGVDQAVEEFDCGVHDGCVDHDNCYDTCHATKGCGTWSAAFCRRGCDENAVSNHSFAEGKSWARGGGPFQRRVTFRYKTPAPFACGCVAPGTEVTLEDGSRRAIEKLGAGEGILAFDLDAGVIVKASIERVLIHQDRTYELDQLRAASGEELEVTANHPVFTEHGFVNTEDLIVGDTVFIVDHVSRQTRQERLVAITRRHSTSTVTYNLKTTAGNYFAADMLIHNKCLAAESTIETARGPVSVPDLQPGDKVRGVKAGDAVWTEVFAVYRKTTVLPSLPGRQVNAGLRLTDNHVLSTEGRTAGESDLPAVRIEGPVFDLETGTGNYLANGVLVEAANSGLQCKN